MTMWKIFLSTILFLLINEMSFPSFGKTSDNNPEIKKIKDIIIYKDSMYYSSFPSVIKQPRGEILVAFRRAPNRKLFGEESYSHTDANGYLVMVNSNDGEIWLKDPKLIYAHPLGGSQDPCLLQLNDGYILCASYGWAMVRNDAESIFKRKLPLIKSKRDGGPAYSFLGGYMLSSSNGGLTWQGPIYPPHIAPEIRNDIFGKPIPAYNRGALCESKNGHIYWVVAASDSPSKTSTHLLVSKDKGLTWEYLSQVAADETVSFNEASVYETPEGDIVAFLRTANMTDNMSCIARSKDGGKSFKWQSMNFYGYPLHALKLADKRVLLTYGYRHKPFGIRARILNQECTDFENAPEFIIRDDGVSSDLGYSWSVQLDDKRVLVVYYMNTEDGIRHIAGSIIEISKK